MYKIIIIVIGVVVIGWNKLHLTQMRLSLLTIQRPLIEFTLKSSFELLPLYSFIQSFLIGFSCRVTDCKYPFHEKVKFSFSSILPSAMCQVSIWFVSLVLECRNLRKGELVSFLCHSSWEIEVGIFDFHYFTDIPRGKSYWK